MFLYASALLSECFATLKKFAETNALDFLALNS